MVALFSTVSKTLLTVSEPFIMQLEANGKVNIAYSKRCESATVAQSSLVRSLL